MRTLSYLILFITTSINAQENDCQFPKDEKTGEVLITDVVNVDSITQSKLFVLINEWFASTYNDANSVIQLSDKEAGVIIGKGRMKQLIQASENGMGSNVIIDFYLNYTLKVETKDNRYRYQLKPTTVFIPGESLSSVTIPDQTIPFSYYIDYCELSDNELILIQRNEFLKYGKTPSDKRIRKSIQSVKFTSRQIVNQTVVKSNLIVASLYTYILKNKKGDEW